ncbi:hypothetical protein GQ472_05485 [archaeon]|nr:hypothetical protein [archaeon]
MTPISAHLSERKTLVQNKIASDYSSKLWIGKELVQEVTDKRLLTLTIRSYPYIDIITLLDEGQNTQEICNYSDMLPKEKLVINETINRKDNIRWDLSREIRTETKGNITQDIGITNEWYSDSMMGTTKTQIYYSNGEGKKLGSEKTLTSNRKVSPEELEKLIDGMSRFIRDDEGNDFFFLFRDAAEKEYGKPEDIYIKHIIKDRRIDPAISDIVNSLDTRPLYPFENDPAFTATYSILEFGYQKGDTREYIKAIAFKPSEETGNRPVYMIIKEDINIEEGIEYVEKDIFIDDDKTALLKHLV